MSRRRKSCAGSRRAYARRIFPRSCAAPAGHHASLFHLRIPIHLAPTPTASGFVSPPPSLHRRQATACSQRLCSPARPDPPTARPPRVTAPPFPHLVRLHPPPAVHYGQQSRDSTALQREVHRARPGSPPRAAVASPSCRCTVLLASSPTSSVQCPQWLGMCCW